MKRGKRDISRRLRSLALFLMVGLLLMPRSLEARALGVQEVRAAIQTWVRGVTADARPEAVIVRMEPHRVNGETVAYIAHLLSGGFCLCGADDLVLPVYFYSPQGTYNPQNPDYQYVLWEIEARMKHLREGFEKSAPEVIQYQGVLSKRASVWQDLVAGVAPGRIEGMEGKFVEPDSMSLRLTCQWSQGSPYNDQCPELTPGADEHTKVGCVATAMSQIMYYWQWPVTGLGSDTATYSFRWRNEWDEEPLADDPGIPAEAPWIGRLDYDTTAALLKMKGYWDKGLYKYARTDGRIDTDSLYLEVLDSLWNRLTQDTTVCHADFGATNYNWSIIEDIHTDPPGAGDAEVAELCYHAGIATKMRYGVRTSVAFTGSAEDALEDHFRYDPDAISEARDIDIMTEEVQWLRPVDFWGVQPDSIGGGGHAWVVFGYNKATDPDRQFKLNMGWGGGSDGWYCCDTVPGSFTINQGHITRIAPTDVVKFVGEVDPGDGSPDDPYEHIEEAIAEAPDGATLIFKAGSDNTFSEASLIIDRPFTLKGRNTIIR